ncbi:MAG: hypothetical protein HFG81_02180, partial [Dorea sp.]|nr:hypothetical protein [Dorea sp.]
GDKSEIMSLLERLSSRRIFLVHGNREAIEELGNELAAEDYRRQVYLPECGQEYRIELRRKRKQTAFYPVYTMQMEREFMPEDEKLLWDYWQEHYLGKALSISQIAWIWYGRACDSDEAALARMQDIFRHSNYFSANVRRLFLFEANTREAVAEALAPKELTMQELELKILNIFQEYPYRKIGYHFDRKEALLQFDYPDSQDMENFQEKARIFASETGWNIRINPATNHSAAGILLSLLFGERLLKTSYFQDRKCYSITLSGKDNKKADREASRRFEAETGWRLLINGRAETGWNPLVHGNAGVGVYLDDENIRETYLFVPEDVSVKVVEQNQAFLQIDLAFASLSHRPDKKSLKQDSMGKYLELSFISPMIGRRYQKVIQTLANQTGWRIRIADKVNQNTLFKNIQVLCMKRGITPVKNPSYLPERKTVQVKVRRSLEPEILDLVAKEFQKQTGCGCEMLTV